MARRQKEPLRAVTAAERAELERVARMGSDRADRVTRARALLAAADGSRFTEAARAAGRRSGDAVGRLVARFNREGLAAVDPRHGGGPRPRYGAVERERILHEFRRAPDRERDGTATWSLTTLRRALRRAPDGLPTVSTATILGVLWEAGYRWQRDRTWCHTGQARRRRRDGTVVTVTDPQATPKKRCSSAPTAPARRSGSRSGARMKPAPTRPSPSPACRGSQRGCRPAAPTSTSEVGPPSC